LSISEKKFERQGMGSVLTLELDGLDGLEIKLQTLSKNTKYSGPNESNGQRMRTEFAGGFPKIVYLHPFDLEFLTIFLLVLYLYLHPQLLKYQIHIHFDT
jgi:hypothetical protein